MRTQSLSLLSLGLVSTLRLRCRALAVADVGSVGHEIMCHKPVDARVSTICQRLLAFCLYLTPSVWHCQNPAVLATILKSRWILVTGLPDAQQPPKKDANSTHEVIKVLHCLVPNCYTCPIFATSGTRPSQASETGVCRCLRRVQNLIRVEARSCGLRISSV